MNHDATLMTYRQTNLKFADQDIFNQIKGNIYQLKNYLSYVSSWMGDRHSKSSSCRLIWHCSGAQHSNHLLLYARVHPCLKTCLSSSIILLSVYQYAIAILVYKGIRKDTKNHYICTQYVHSLWTFLCLHIGDFFNILFKFMRFKIEKLYMRIWSLNSSLFSILLYFCILLTSWYL